MLQLRTLGSLLVTGVFLSSTNPPSPNMTISAPAPELRCYGAYDWVVEGEARTLLSESGDLEVWIEWELVGGGDEGTIATGGGFNARSNAREVIADSYGSGSADLGSSPQLHWWTYHGAEVGSWSDADDTYTVVGCTVDAELASHPG